MRVRFVIPVSAIVISAGLFLAAGRPAPAGTASTSIETPQQGQGPKNVKIHTDKTLRQLQVYMRDMAAQLGVQCDYCHDTSDFSLDTKEHKRKARQFMQMVKDINDKYIPWEGGDAERHEVVCWNCHQGQQHPPHWEGAGVGR